MPTKILSALFLLFALPALAATSHSKVAPKPKKTVTKTTTVKVTKVAHKAAKKPPPEPHTLILTDLPSFNAIEIDPGVSHLSITCGKSKQSVQLYGEPGIKHEVTISVKHHTLMLKLKHHLLSHNAPPIDAVVTLRNLNSVAYQGNGTVQIKNLVTKEFRLKAKTKGSIFISGNVGLHYLEAQGTGNITLYWVDSDGLTVLAKGGIHIKLAGISTNMNTEIEQNAVLDARFLRVLNAYVHTQDKGRADVWVMQNLHTYATGHSNIYYYTKPQFYTQDIQQFGASLSMVGIPSALMNF